MRTMLQPDDAASSCRAFHTAGQPSAPTSGTRSVHDGRDAGVERAHRLVDGVLGHHPVGRVLAAGDDDQARRRVADDVLAGQLGRRVALARQQRPQPGVHALDVGRGQR